ncbi:hypothetical protein L6452_06996 [Arctium lappa]|uniref:Uncharacterized protein n=1 Tax=Arctium lappa TaxID=4217 RepID=A0ACB9EJQ7_ARCLA|nr:hypothetical protein L6452_06996 [Arctium lappa]
MVEESNFDFKDQKDGSKVQDQKGEGKQKSTVESQVDLEPKGTENLPEKNFNGNPAAGAMPVGAASMRGVGGGGSLNHNDDLLEVEVPRSMVGNQNQSLESAAGSREADKGKNVNLEKSGGSLK